MWKLLVENTQRDAIFTFPYGTNTNHSDHARSTVTMSTGNKLLQALTICLLSERGKLVMGDPSTPVKQTAASEVFETDPKSVDTVQKPQVRAAQFPRPAKDGSRGMRQPKFLSGVIHGQPV